MLSSPRLPASIGVVVLLALAPADVLPQSAAKIAENLLLGTWRIDLQASRYSPGPPVRSETRTYIRDDKGIAGRIDRTHADGRREVIDYRADVEQQVPVSGTRAYDAIRLTRMDMYTTEGVLSHAGRVFGYSRRTISPDGRTMTITFRRGEPGDMVNNVVVYRKEQMGR
jgi:hypothetical protein